MKTISSSVILAFFISPITLYAYPLFSFLDTENALLPRRPATYSVVPVDGGTSAAPAPATQTVTMPVTQTLLSTMISTSIVTQNEIPSTIYNTVVVTFTSVVPTTIFETVSTSSAPVPISIQSITSDVADPTSKFAPAVSTVTVPWPVITFDEAPQTVTVMETPSSTTYDDGMWHTTYWHYVSPSSTSPSPTPPPSTGYPTWNMPLESMISFAAGMPAPTRL